MTPSYSSLVPSEEPTGPPVIRNEGVPKKLTLTDIFEHVGWEEGLAQIPQSPTPLQAMFTNVGCYDIHRMEIRLAQATGSAAITVAQALNARSSTVSLEFKLLANQRLVDTKIVKFDQVATLTTPVDGVSALTLEVRTAKGSDCDTTAVVTEFLLTPKA